MATHSNILAWEIPWTKEPGGLSPWCHRESDMTWRVNNNIKITQGAWALLPTNETTVIGEQRVVDCPAVFPAVREECREDEK